MRTHATAGLLTALAVLTSSPAGAAEHVVVQRDFAFVEDHLTVRVGDSVTFTNADLGFHNVFSISEPKPFDLGMFANGHAKSVTFDQAGEVRVECSIHPFMKMTVHVVE